MVILYYQWVMLDHHFEILKVISDFLLVWMKIKIQLTLKQYISYFTTYEIVPGIYSSKDTSVVILTKGDHQGPLQNEYDDIRMKTEFNLTRFGLTFRD